MKKYVEFELKLITVSAQDIVTLSPFDGEEDEFDAPGQTAEQGIFTP